MWPAVAETPALSEPRAAPHGARASPTCPPPSSPPPSRRSRRARAPPAAASRCVLPDATTRPRRSFVPRAVDAPIGRFATRAPTRPSPPLLIPDRSPQVTRAAVAPPASPALDDRTAFRAAPLSYFALDQLELKGPRSNVDVGDPHDYARPFVKGALDGAVSCGSWACSPGGWNSPNPRPSTEWFYVLGGRGAVTDPDGVEHAFGPGDVVILPEGWRGRWDIHEHIHKVWLTLTHDHVPGAPDRPVVVSRASLIPNAATGTVTGTVAYDACGARAGAWTRPAGSDVVVPPVAAPEMWHVVEGECYVTDADGATARRCAAGDSVFLPAGWTGRVAAVRDCSAVAVSANAAAALAAAGAPAASSAVYRPAQATRNGELDELYDPENERRR